MTLQQQIEGWGYKTQSYSGRGMEGRECLGVIIGGINELFLLGSRCPHFGNVSVRTDTLGYDTIAYFPGIYYSEQ